MRWKLTRCNSFGKFLTHPLLSNDSLFFQQASEQWSAGCGHECFCHIFFSFVLFAHIHYLSFDKFKRHHMLSVEGNTIHILWKIIAVDSRQKLSTKMHILKITFRRLLSMCYYDLWYLMLRICVSLTSIRSLQKRRTFISPVRGCGKFN